MDYQLANMQENMALYQSPIGKLIITANDKFITSVKPFDANKTIISFSLKQSMLIIACIKQLDEYFKGERKNFNIPIQFNGTEFQKKVWNKLIEIEYGKTCSYIQLANLMGNPALTRAVANANAKNKHVILVPCHRIIGTNHTMVGYVFGGIKNKKWLLNLETNRSNEVLELF